MDTFKAEVPATVRKGAHVSTRCTIQHRDDETRARCHNADCRRAAATSRSTSNGPVNGPPPRADEIITIPDSRGNPIHVSSTNPRIRNRVLGPEAADLLPAGTRLEGCKFSEGDFALADVTVERCQVGPKARLALGGHSVISGSTLHGQVLLGGETFSDGNTYQSHVQISQRAQSADDYFRVGYVPEGDDIIVSRPSGIAETEPETEPRDQTADSQPAKRPSSVRGGLLPGVGAMMRRTPLPRARGGSRRGGGRRRR